MTSNQDQVSAIVLSGGRGRRFDNADKGLICWREKPLIGHVIDCLAPQCQQLLINCNRNAAHYQAFGLPVFADENPDFPGPLEGIRSTSAAVIHPWCLVCPNDMPKLPANLVQRLLSEAQNRHSQIVYPICGERRHYLPVLIRSDILYTVEKQLLTPDHSLHGWYQQFAVAIVDFSDQAEAFSNINSPSELEALS